MKMRITKWAAIGAMAALSMATGDARANGLAVKNFRQIFQSLAVSTGISPQDREIGDYYAQSYSRLPQRGDVDEIGSSGLLTTTALSGMFCGKMVVADSKLASGVRRAHSAVDFTKGPTALEADVQVKVIEAYFGLFLSRSPSMEEVGIVKEAFAELISNTENKPEGTLAVLTGACTSVASALDSLIL
jgi:hypothetical protein